MTNIWPIETFNEDLKLLPCLAAHELKQIADLFLASESFNLRITRPSVLTALLAYLHGNLGLCAYSVSFNPVARTYLVAIEVLPELVAV